MGKFKATRRSVEKVMPSGVAITMLNLTGEHQALITSSDEKKRRNAIDEMLLGCISRIGDNYSPTLEDIGRLLSQDRAWCLFELRQFSNKRSPNFIFDYEYPVDDNGYRRKQRYEVIFNREDFPQRPYYWTFEKMAEDYKKENGIELKCDLSENQIASMLEKPYPELFSNYNEMLEIYKKQEVLLEDSNVVVYWEMMDGDKEKSYAKNANKKNVSSHDQILQRNPRYNDGESELDNLPAVPLNELSQDDIEQLREDIVSKEAFIDTSVVLQYKEDARTTVSLNLITVPAFFFPSLAK